MFGFSAIVRQFLTPPPRLLILPILIRALGANDVFNNVPGRVGFDIILCDLDLCVVTKSESFVRTLRSALFFSVIDVLGTHFFQWPVLAAGFSLRVPYIPYSKTLSAKVFAGKKTTLPWAFPPVMFDMDGMHAWQKNAPFLTSPSRVTCRDVECLPRHQNPVVWGPVWVPELQAKSGS